MSLAFANLGTPELMILLLPVALVLLIAVGCLFYKAGKSKYS